MRRRVAIILALCFCCTFTFARQKGTAFINYGIKGGFSSTFYEVNNFMVAQRPIHEFIAKSEISSFYTVFARINIKRHYIQTEGSYNISNYSIEFDKDLWDSSAQPHESSIISTKIVGLEVPLYYGYHVLKEGPYGMSLYFGPKAKFILTDYSNHTFENSPYKTLEEDIYPINFSLMAGLGINISRIFFDFSFEYGLHNISKGFNTTDAGNSFSTNSLVFNRRKNVLSFSIGFMF